MTNELKNLKIGMVSLGCPKNLVDAECMLGLLRDCGASITRDPAKADVIIVNTCGFIESAKQESINTTLEMARYGKPMVLAGCLAQRYGDELAAELPEVNVLLGVHQVGDVARAVLMAANGERAVMTGAGTSCANFASRVLATPGYMAYVKIAEGCSNQCSYCAIPAIRGPLKSRAMEDVADEVKALRDRGVKEIVLVAQDTTMYGADIYGQRSLAELLARLRHVDGLTWIRVLYAYPESIDDELIDAMMADGRVCRYIDMPIQHINDDVLRAMNRRSTKRQIYDAVERIRRAGGFVLRTSLIAGFPGETEAQHAELLAALRDIRFERAGVFGYSAEEGTKAALMPQLDPSVIEARREALMAAQREVSAAYNKTRLGKTYEVLAEGRKKGLTYGRSFAEAPEIDGKVFFAGEPSLGEVVRVNITKAYDYDLMGELI